MYNQIESNKRKTVLLIAIFGAMIVALALVLQYVFGYGDGIFVAALAFATLQALVGYFHGDTLALWSNGARPVTKEENSYLHNMVENLCISAGIPTPKIYMIDSPAINAFATGRDPKHASIAVTRGAIEQLENEELEGVIGHELSHITNYDIRVMTIVVVLAGTVALVGHMFWRSRFLGMGGGGRDNNRGGNQLGAILMIVGLVFIVLSPIIAELIKLAISRKREFLADASGALLTRYPEGLARALEKIKQSNTPLETASAATAHLFIASPFASKSLSNLFSTHPPVEERVKRLREM